MNPHEEDNSGCLPVVIAVIIGLACVGVFSILVKEKIFKSREIIEPTIQLTLKNQVIDTLYVYKLK